MSEVGLDIKIRIFLQCHDQSGPIKWQRLFIQSGKFVRGDSQTLEFSVLGRVESFSVSEVSQITFKNTEPVAAAAAKATVPPSQAKVVAPVARKTAPQLVNKPATQPLERDIQREDPILSTATLPAGTPITIRTSSTIDTDRNRVGDVFDASLEEDLVSGDQIVVPRGATVKGRIAYAKESGKLTGQSQLILELTELVASGKSYILRTSDYTEVGASRGNRTAATVGGTAALGAIIGAIAGGGKGAAIGAASGAAVGTGVQVVTKGQTLKIPAETILEFRLQAPLTVDIP